jgi:hypothetical protein
LAVTFDGTNYKIYIDGIQLATAAGNPPEVTTSDVECILGALDDSYGSYNTATNNFNGWLDELRIWNVALNSEQLHQMMNQEIESNGALVKGKIVPSDINGLLWSNLLGYYHMTINDCGYLVPTVGASGRLRNINSTQDQTAPIPYTSANDGNWNTNSVWSQPVVWDVPNSIGINGDPINWNIVKILNNNIINSGDRDITLLGLISESGKLTMNGITGADGTGTGQGLWITHYLELDGVIDFTRRITIGSKKIYTYTI